MTCIAPPKPALPTLPAPFSIPKPPLPGLPNPQFCCQLPDVIPTVPPVPWPGPVDPGSIAALNAALGQAQAAIQAYLDALPLDCPRTESP